MRYSISLETDTTSESLSVHQTIESAVNTVGLYNTSSQRKGGYSESENPNFVIARDGEVVQTIKFKNY